MQKFRYFRRQADRMRALTCLIVALAAILASVRANSRTTTYQLASQFDAVTGEYRLQSNDSEVLGLKIQYSSKLRHRGLFGWGWCSELDAALYKSESGVYVYKGCEFQNGELLDPRQSARNLEFTKSGQIRRLRLDGIEQIFSLSGELIGLRKRNGEKVNISRLQNTITLEGEQLVRLLVENDHGRAREIQVADGRKWRLDFEGGLLVQFGEEIYRYDRQRRMIRRDREGEFRERENVEYRSDGEGIGRFERQTASPENRLLVRVRMNEESGKIEIEAERGAEMHPVRILYHIQFRTLEFFGDRKTARVLLKHLIS